MSYIRIKNRPNQSEALRQMAALEFTDLRHSAEWRRIWNKISRHPATLLPYAPVRGLLKDHVPKCHGVQEVSVKDIVGSSDRAEQFDRDFRPLNNASRSRWIDVRLLSENVGWAPVTLYRLGNLYFVVDGHHRISIARYLEIKSIEAWVCDYMVPVRFDHHVSLEELLDHLGDYLHQSQAISPHLDYADPKSGTTIIEAESYTEPVSHTSAGGGCYCR